MPRPHPPEFTASGPWSSPGSGDKPIAKIADDLEIAESRLRNWIKQARASPNVMEAPSERTSRGGRRRRTPGPRRDDPTPGAARCSRRVSSGCWSPLGLESEDAGGARPDVDKGPRVAGLRHAAGPPR